MAGDVTRDEFDHLRTRVDIVEREVEGEKLVTHHILEQTRRNGDDLATLNTRVGRVEGKVDALAQDLTGLRGMVHGLVANLPGVVRDALRECCATRKGDGFRCAQPILLAEDLW